jgi:hypothetical protein
MPAAAARSSARSAPSSTCRAANRAAARPTMSSDRARQLRAGHHSFFITDDNFARNKDWEAIFDRLISCARSRHPHRLDHPGRHAVPQDAELHRQGARAGVRASSSAWRTSIPTICWPPRSGRTRSPNTARCCWPGSARHHHLCGYILGFPNDTPESILRDIEIIKRELPVDLLEFFLPDAAAGLGGPSQARGARAPGWTPTSTSTTSSASAH